MCNFTCLISKQFKAMYFCLLTKENGMERFHNKYTIMVLSKKEIELLLN